MSEVGISLSAPAASQFAPGARVSVSCGAHEFTGIVRRCEPVGHSQMHYGIEFDQVGSDTLDKLRFYSTAGRGEWIVPRMGVAPAGASSG
ncbi:MAG: PilZ domain-containing protein [Microthrixaceae bacterium]|nr:PilZ domain-containing protein [Microthrixaceae bacterium]